MRRLASIPAALCVGMALGCGDDGGGEEGDRGAVTVPAGGKVRVLADEYSFTPASLVLEAPGRITITLDNRGALAHNLKVLHGGRDLGGTPTFQGGRTESGTVELERGRYEMVCTVGNHAELGMVGTLEVR
jgi:plastocyanin